MIVEWFIAFVFGLVGALADWLPTWDIPDGSAGAMSFVLTLNNVVPAAEAIAVLVFTLALHVLLFIYRLIKTALAHAPLVGGTG